MLKETLRKVVQLQREELKEKELGIKRDLLKKIDLKVPHGIILSGIRRCGKSTLLRQLMQTRKKFYYFNFEDQRVLDFKVSDFEKLEAVFMEEFGESDYFFFDEIQNVQNWEMYVRKTLDNGKKVIVTGSNASLLSRELGTKLTGRHLTYELFPFSYIEMLRLISERPSLKSFERYFKSGGLPEFLKYKKTEILQELFNDILTRDIIVRYKIRDVKSLKELAIFLITNSGKEVSYNKLASYCNIKSTTTAISYASFLEDAYLFFTVPKFSYSYKKQLINPKKIYCIDVGLAHANSVSFSADKGRILENLVYQHLRRIYKDVYYFKEKRECDFVVREKNQVVQVVQVCYDLNEENKDREIEGLHEAMEFFQLKKGTIITYNQEDKMGNIDIVPAWKYFS